MTSRRDELIAAALRLLDAGGQDAVQARKVAIEAGTSTMALYTDFDGMGELVEELAKEGFRLLTARMAVLADSADPVADLLAKGLAYRQFALDRPHLYALMFGLSAPGGRRVSTADLTRGATSVSEEGAAAFGHLVTVAGRAIDAGRFRAGDPVLAAVQLWSGLHGYVLLEMAGYFGEQADSHVLAPFGNTLVIGLGDRESAAAESAAAAREVWLRAAPGANLPGS